MRNLVPELYRKYGCYTNKSKMLPNKTDGLLPVQKRVLLGGHVICKDKFVKTNAVLGGVMAKWHPHSEALGTAQWAVLNKFMDGEGSWGTKIGAEPFGCAAMRYTSLKSNSFIEEIAFKYVNNVPWIADECEPEPVIVPTMIPFCLMCEYETTMIAFGFKTEIPCYDIKDLVKRLLWLETKNGSEPIIKPKLNGCKILNDKKELQNILTTGRGKLDISGVIEEDLKNHRIIIKSWSPRFNFKTIINRINNYENYNLFENGDVGFRDDSNKKKGTRCILEVVRQKNKDRIYDQLKESVENVLKSTISYNIYTVDHKGTVHQSGVDEMLKLAFRFHKAAHSSFLRESIKKLNESKTELEIISKIRPHISDEMKITDDSSLICNNLANKVDVTADSIKVVISKYNIKKLMSVNLDISDLDKKINDLQNSLKNIDVEEINQYEELLK